tara:strand:+ start:464062 stop:464214 length:153 start_codon:yes stop_codon:yes gene_type:complete
MTVLTNQLASMVLTKIALANFSLCFCRFCGLLKMLAVLKFRLGFDVTIVR